MHEDSAKILIKTTTNSVGQPIAFPSEGTPEITAFLFELKPGEETGWHQHPVPLFGYILEGEATVYQRDGERRVVRAGEVSLESVGSWHNGVNEGDEVCRMIVFVAGIKGAAFTIGATATAGTFSEYKNSPGHKSVLK